MLSPQARKTRKLKPSEVTVNFIYNENWGLAVRIETPRLLIRSVTEDDIDNYFNLFSDPQVMEKFATGKPIIDKSLIENRIRGWVTRWQNKIPDPFNGLQFLKSIHQNSLDILLLVEVMKDQEFLSSLIFFIRNFGGKVMVAKLYQQ